MSWHGPLGNVLMLLFGLTVWSPTSLAVSASSEDARDVVKRGTMEVGVATGFWQATTVVGSGPSANRSAVFVLPRAGVVMTDALGSGWWEGNVELLAEPLFARFTQPYAAEVVGGSLVVKYSLVSFGRWLLCWDAGAGMVWSNRAPRIPEESTNFQFVLETGPGVLYFMTKSMTMVVRFQSKKHTSELRSLA